MFLGYSSWLRRLAVALDPFVGTRVRPLPMRFGRGLARSKVCRQHLPVEIGLSYNSCRNRHSAQCPCQARRRWIDARTQELLQTRWISVAPLDHLPLFWKSAGLYNSCSARSARFRRMRRGAKPDRFTIDARRSRPRRLIDFSGAGMKSRTGRVR